jgi:3-oxoacyl-[acyl-carrier protein] reductase
LGKGPADAKKESDVRTYTSLEGQVVLITGANHGIGAATARAFTAQGASVFLTYHREPCPFSRRELEKAQEDNVGGVTLYRANQQQTPEPLVDEIRSGGGRAAMCEMDLSVAGNIPVLFDLCRDALGEPDILVNNHAYCAPDTFDPALTTDEGFVVKVVDDMNIDASFAVNARAFALLMSEYVSRFLVRAATSGRIINISTDAAHAHVANVSYAASKHAIESYSRSAAVELGRYGITVNIVAPGPVQTGYLTPEEVANIAAATPLGRVGRPDDVADVIVFLASDQARWLTGQLIYAGGGWRIHQ